MLLGFSPKNYHPSSSADVIYTVADSGGSGNVFEFLLGSAAAAIHNMSKGVMG